MHADRRQINDYRLHVFGQADDRLIAFVCECADDDCLRAVPLTRAAFDDLRGQGKPVLFHGHAPDDDAALTGEQRETGGAVDPSTEGRPQASSAS